MRVPPRVKIYKRLEFLTWNKDGEMQKLAFLDKEKTATFGILNIIGHVKYR